MNSILETILLVIVSLSSALSDIALSNGTDTSESSDCDPEWHSFGNKCFKYHNDLVGANFHNAISICERTHLAQLVTIHSEEEAKFINWMLFDYHSSKFSAWIGLVRVNNDTFTWLDRTPLNYTRWAPNEPNNWNSKNFCVVLSSETSFKGLWYDVGCTSTYVVICEKQKTLDKQTKTKEETNQSLVNSVERLQETVILLQNSLAQIQININSLESSFSENNELNILSAKSNNSFATTKTRFHMKNANSDKSADLVTVQLNQQSMWRFTQVNFALVLLALILILSTATYICLSPKCPLPLHQLDDSASDSISRAQSRHKPWYCRSESHGSSCTSSSSSSSYVPSSLGRLYRSTLGKLKSANSSFSQSPLSASYTAQGHASDTESILTRQNVATSIWTNIQLTSQTKDISSALLSQIFVHFYYFSIFIRSCATLFTLFFKFVILIFFFCRLLCLDRCVPNLINNQ